MYMKIADVWHIGVNGN